MADKTLVISCDGSKLRFGRKKPTQH